MSQIEREVRFWQIVLVVGTILVWTALLLAWWPD